MSEAYLPTPRVHENLETSDNFRPKIAEDFRWLPTIAEDFPTTSEDNRGCKRIFDDFKPDSPTVFRRKKKNRISI